MSYSHIPAQISFKPELRKLPPFLNKERFRAQRQQNSGSYNSLFGESEESFKNAFAVGNADIGNHRKKAISKNASICMEYLQAALVGGNVTGHSYHEQLPSGRYQQFQPDIIDPSVSEDTPTLGSLATEVKMFMRGGAPIFGGTQDANYAHYLVRKINDEGDTRAGVDYALFQLDRKISYSTKIINGEKKQRSKRESLPAKLDDLMIYCAQNTRAGLVLPHAMMLGIRQIALARNSFAHTPRKGIPYSSDFLKNIDSIPEHTSIPMKIQTGLLNGSLSMDEFINLVETSYDELRGTRDGELPITISPELKKMYGEIRRDVIFTPPIWVETSNKSVMVEPFGHVRYAHPDKQQWAGFFGENYATLLAQSGLVNIYDREQEAEKKLEMMVTVGAFAPWQRTGTDDQIVDSDFNPFD